MVKCNKKRCQVCNFMRQEDKFRSSVAGKTYYVNHVFDCDSEGVIYLITCKKCGLQYVGNTVTSFRLRFNNHKSSMMRYGKGKRGICGQKLYAHFYTEGHEGLMDLEIQVIHITNVNSQMNGKVFGYRN